jgi:hypothetical protein
MSREMMIGMLQAGKTGDQILQILETIAVSDVTEEDQPTMEEIKF